MYWHDSNFEKHEDFLMNEKLLMETVALAGKIMLASGAEVYRVEETMKYMLQKSSYPVAEAVALGTGLFVSLDDLERDTLTIARRVPARSTNLNRICAVNEVSRRFCSNQLTVEEAYSELRDIESDKVYTRRWTFLGMIGVSAFFAPIFGGGLLDVLGSGIVGVISALADWLVKKVKLNDFFINAFCAFTIAIGATVVRKFILPGCSSDVMIISSIMSLVPGVAFTTSIRDILNGDYASGSARMLEAIVVALAIAAGVGLGLVFWGVFWRWLT